MMSEEEIIKALREMNNKKVEELEEPSKSLFNAVMKIADMRDALADASNQLQQENKQLKERIIYLENSNNRREETIINLRHEQQLDLYKEVVEEVRKCIESKNNGVCIINGEEKGAYTFLLDFGKAREFVWELLQILDKAKEDNNE